MNNNNNTLILNLLLLSVLIFISAGVAAGNKNTSIKAITGMVESGEWQSARTALREIRQQRYPGKSVSGEVCRNMPIFILLLSSERSLQRSDSDAALNYLQQLNCLEMAGQKKTSFRNRKQQLELDKGFSPRLPSVCPRNVSPGQHAIKDSADLIAGGDIKAGENQLLRAACLLGYADQRVPRLFDRLKNIRGSDKLGREPAAVEHETQTNSVTYSERTDPKPVGGTAAPKPLIRPTPKPVKTRVAEQDLKSLIRDQQTPGEVAHNIPSTMQVDESIDVEVRIQQSTVDASGMSPADKVEIRDIATTGTMSVELCCGEPGGGFPFDIRPLSLNKQPVTDDEFTQWVFNITARKPGDQKLKLIIYGEYKMPSGEVFGKNYPIETIPVDVEVLTSSMTIKVLAGIACLLILLILWFFIKQKNKMADVFISYRRDDSAGWTQSLHDQLTRLTEHGEIFMDLHDIPPGIDFPQYLSETLKQTKVVLVVIGKKWLSAVDSEGKLRIMNPDDWVRQEIKVALESGKNVIPVLVDGSSMPSADSLPEDIRKLSRLNAVNLHPDFFQEGVNKLVASIQHPIRSSLLRRD